MAEAATEVPATDDELLDVGLHGDDSDLADLSPAQLDRVDALLKGYDAAHKSISDTAKERKAALEKGYPVVDPNARAPIDAGGIRAEMAKENLLKRPQGIFSGDETPPQQLTPQQESNPLLRGIANLPDSAGNMVVSTARFPFDAARHPLNTAGGILKGVGGTALDTAKAALSMQLGSIFPGLDKYAEQYGISPDDFVNRIASDPVGTVGNLAILGGLAKGAVSKFTQAGKPIAVRAPVVPAGAQTAVEVATKVVPKSDIVLRQQPDGSFAMPKQLPAAIPPSEQVTLYRGVAKGGFVPGASANKFGPVHYYADKESAAEVYRQNRGEGATIERVQVDPSKYNMFDERNPEADPTRYAALLDALKRRGVFPKTFTLDDFREILSDGLREGGSHSTAEFSKRFIKPKLGPDAKMWAADRVFADAVREAGYDGITEKWDEGRGLPEHTEYAFFKPVEQASPLPPAPASIGGPAASAASGGTGGVFNAIVSGMTDTAPFAPLENFVQNTKVALGFHGKLQGVTEPLFFRLAPKAPDLHGALWRKMAAPNDVAYVRDGWVRDLTKIVGKKKLDDFAAVLWDDNLESTPQGQGKGLPPAERAKLLADPQIQAGLAYWNKEAVPEFEQFAADAGITLNKGRQNYVKLEPFDSDFHAKQGTQVPDVGDGPAYQGPFKARRAKAARQATGSAQYYLGDPTLLNQVGPGRSLPLMIQETLRDRVLVARHNQLFDMVETYKVPPDPVTGQPPKLVTSGPFAGERVVMAPHEKYFRDPVTHLPVKAVSMIPLPQSVAKAYGEALTPYKNFWQENFPPMAAVNNAALQVMLMTPGESVQHASGLLGSVFMGSELSKGGKLALEPIAGRTLSIIARTFDHTGPDAARDYRTLSQLGGLRMERHATTALGKAIEIALGKKAVFGRYGIENRIRLTTFRALKMADPAMSDTEAVARMNNQEGTYLGHGTPALVKAMKAIPIFGDPFAAAGVAQIKTAIKGAFGFTNNGWRAEMAWIGPASLILTPMVTTKLSTGKWPWEFVPGTQPKHGDIRVAAVPDKPGKPGYTVDIPYRSIYPGPARAATNLPIRSIMEDVNAGTASVGTIGRDVVINAANDVLHRTGQVGRIGLALIGKAPHLTKSWELMQITDKTMDMGAFHNQFVNNLEHALLAMHPLTADEVGMMQEGQIEAQASPIAEALLRAARAVGATPTIKPSEKVQAAMTEMSKYGLSKDVQEQIVAQAKAVPKAQQTAFLQDKLKNIAPEFRAKAMIDMQKRLMFSGAAVNRSAAKASK